MDQPKEPLVQASKEHPLQTLFTELEDHRSDVAHQESDLKASRKDYQEKANKAESDIATAKVNIKTQEDKGAEIDSDIADNKKAIKVLEAKVDGLNHAKGLAEHKVDEIQDALDAKDYEYKTYEHSG